METLGPLIRNRRVRQLGLTMEVVAERARMSKPYLSSIETERQRNTPSDALLAKLEGALEWSPGYLTRRAALLRTPPEILALIPPATVEAFLEGTTQRGTGGSHA